MSAEWKKSKKSRMISEAEKFNAECAENAEGKQCAKFKRFAFTGR